MNSSAGSPQATILAIPAVVFQRSCQRRVTQLSRGRRTTAPSLPAGASEGGCLPSARGAAGHCRRLGRQHRPC